MSKVATYLGATVIAAWVFCGATLATFMIDALVLKTLWGWFVVPTFGLPSLTVPLAGGLVAIGYLISSSGASSSSAKRSSREEPTQRDPKEMRRSAEEARLAVLSFVVRPVLILAAGWLFKAAM